MKNADVITECIKLAQSCIAPMPAIIYPERVAFDNGVYAVITKLLQYQKERTKRSG